jgi:drug/metabolite transporter (DMT)-like permease
VLRPEEREHRELEVVRLALEQRDDVVEFPVREAEPAVERCFRDGAQDVILPAAPATSRRFPEGLPVLAARVALVTRRDALLLLLLSAIWGSSFMFIRLGVDELEPSVVVLARTVVGALVLLPLVVGRGGLRPLRAAIVPVVVLGALNNAVPFWLLGFAETHLDSGLTAVIQAAAPIFTVVLAFKIDPSQRVTGARLVGIGVGFVGVALLVGAQRGGDLLGALAVLGTAACYAASALFAGRTVRHLPPLQVSIGQLTVAALLMLPFGLAQLPAERPPAGTIAAVVALGALGSGIAYLLYFGLIASAGASRAVLVTYLVPAFALVYGAVFLSEHVSVTSLVGLALILGGTTLATGLARGRWASD